MGGDTPPFPRPSHTSLALSYLHRLHLQDLQQKREKLQEDQALVAKIRKDFEDRQVHSVSHERVHFAEVGLHYYNSDINVGTPPIPPNTQLTQKRNAPTSSYQQDMRTHIHTHT